MNGPTGAFVELDAAGATDRFDAEVIVVGAGFAGTLMALLLARQGRATLVVDPNLVHPGDFRCEKLSLDQAQLIADLGVGEAFGLAPDGDPQMLTRRGFGYDEMVNGLRGLWPPAVVQIAGKVVGIAPSKRRTEVTLSDGRTLAAKLVILATGLGERLRADLGLTRQILSPAHSVSLGLTLEAPAARRQALIGLVQPGERLGDGVGYASFFAFGSAVRLNLFLYDDPTAGRVARFRQDPLTELVRALPSLADRLQGAKAIAPVQLRVTDLYAVERPARDGVVLIGDARRTSCPASGTGVTRILHDAKLLTAVFMPAWFEADAFDAERIGAFYREPSLEALDTKIHQASLNGRNAATRRSIYWRGRRLAKTLRTRLRAGRLGSGRLAPGRGGAASRATAFHPNHGDVVVVRSAQEILATLDADGRLDAMPFMPEMIAHIGQTMQVARRMERTCVEGPGLRGLTDTVALEGARCDGAMHDGCQRGCILFWKTAWLRPADETVEIDPIAEAAARRRLGAFPTRVGELYTCQSTQLEAASEALPNLHFKQWTKEMRNGDLTLAGFVGIIVRALVNRLRKAMGRPELGLIVGRTAKASKGDLGLKPGDWVRVKSHDEVRAALDAASRNRGLSFEPEMTRYIGSVHRVSDVVERIIDEQKGKMVHLDRTVILDRVVCQGLCNKACPRKNPLFWREAWLERVEPPVA